ncbi:MAG: 30S ribosomal protein THX [Marinoscillum sp.]
MGKGDKKTRRGKIRSGSYGVCRPKKSEHHGETPKKSKKKAS